MGAKKRKTQTSAFKKLLGILGVVSLILGIPLTIKQLFFDSSNIETKKKNESKTEFNNSDQNTVITGDNNTIIFNEKNNPSKGSFQLKKENIIETQKTENKIGKIKIAILPFENISENSKFTMLSKGLPESMLQNISQLENYLVVEGVFRDKLLKEIDFQQGKYVDPSSAAKIGKLLGMEQVVIGSFQINDNKIKISSRSVKVENGQILANSVLEFEDSISDIFKIQKKYAQEFMLNLNK